MSSELLHVGIDLGTSRSAISASNGERFVVDSFVGWPVDMVAKKVLKRNVLIGHEAVSNRTMLDLHRPLEPLRLALEARPGTPAAGPVLPADAFPYPLIEATVSGVVDGDTIHVTAVPYQLQPIGVRLPACGGCSWDVRTPESSATGSM